MQIYVAHSASFDFQNELYAPIQNSELAKSHQFILPYLESPVNSKEAIKSCDLVLAEVSYPSTGEGIELGWADAFNRKIICIYKTGAKVSSSLNFLNAQKIEYADSTDLVSKLMSVIGQ